MRDAAGGAGDDGMHPIPETSREPAMNHAEPAPAPLHRKYDLLIARAKGV